MKGIALGELFRSAFEATKKNYLVLMVGLALFIGLNILEGLVPDDMGTDISIFVLAFVLLYAIAILVARLVVTLGWVKIALKIVDGQKPENKDYFGSIQLFLGYIGYMIIAGLVFVPAGVVIALGAMLSLGILSSLLILAGILWIFYAILKVWPGVYVIVDEKKGPVDALKTSWSITSGKEFSILGAFILMGLLNLLGLILLVVGLLFTVPMTAVACAGLYRKIRG
jgi:uncharacterized membrane protein